MNGPGLGQVVSWRGHELIVAKVDRDAQLVWLCTYAEWRSGNLEAALRAAPATWSTLIVKGPATVIEGGEIDGGRILSRYGFAGGIEYQRLVNVIKRMLEDDAPYTPPEPLDDLRLALSLAKSAIDAGAQWPDTTVDRLRRYATDCVQLLSHAQEPRVVVPLAPPIVSSADEHMKTLYGIAAQLKHESLVGDAMRLRDENRNLLVENATLRRRLERLERVVRK